MTQYRKRIFFTADLHIGHQSSLDFDNRPFNTLEEMHSGLIKRFNSVLDDDSITYFLGDVGLAKGSIIADVINKIKGTKILVIGNHDGGVNSMYKAGFDCVINSAMMYIANERVTLSHCPLRGVFREDIKGMRGAVDGEMWHKEFKHVKFSIENEGQFHIHGHCHSPNGGKSSRILDRQIDVGVVANKYAPVSISTIESWINKTKKKELDI